MGALRIAVFCLLAVSGCSPEKEPHSSPSAPPVPEQTLRVTASAYNSTPGQTDSRPHEAAWGDSLYPGLRAIAISRDLIPKGLGQGIEVTIDGLPGQYKVMDKMDARWRKRIDVYFGLDVTAAKKFGERKVVIRWRDTGSVDSLTGRAVNPCPEYVAMQPSPGPALPPGPTYGAAGKACPKFTPRTRS